MSEHQKTIIACATATNKQENQDASKSYQSAFFNAVFVGDGLGSYLLAKDAADTVVDFFHEKCNTTELPNEDRIVELFKEAQQLLVDKRSINGDHYDNSAQLYATTLISVFENDDKFVIAYTGNGAIWHIRGSFDEFPTYYHFPWNALNVLNPHTIPQDGREVLYKLISDVPMAEECYPSIITIKKDVFQGDILLICTDGIYSADQLSAGKNDKGVWVKYEPKMLTFFKGLREEFSKIEDYDSGKLGDFLGKYLNTIQASLDDDATVAMLITDTTIAYHKTKNLAKHASSEDN
ncbi:protein phosphatase 2C domain-containing protein [Dyadobacter aurulentus]|uniref:protein phosphatase 2C domain-containing protein n=1 Tax=Dyadobacter sp. UC 10 TaxID=2605428 RepID=UPI0011F300B5|nr:protein phosphatase 2C domain-containing protein [Dyadobacter sp. UC 10]KAA0989279.1 hypothetical protein FXO21_03430 [Dyadobacter sp. UC 10]